MPDDRAGDGEYRDELPETSTSPPTSARTSSRHQAPAHPGDDVRRPRRAAASLGCAISSNGGLLAAAIVLALIAAYHFACAWPLDIDQTEALAVASRTVGFPVGHSCAQLAWHGLRARPVWRILLYSADEPPTMRGLVELDAVDGT